MRAPHLLGLLVFAACAATWPRPTSGGEWQATYRACRDGNQAACYWKAREEEPSKRRAIYQAACDANVGSTIPYRPVWRGPTVLKNRTMITGTPRSRMYASPSHSSIALEQA